MGKNPLNSNEVDGNTMAWMADQDMCKVYYHCKECNKDIIEDEFNNKGNMCYDCWWGNMKRGNYIRTKQHRLG